MSSNSSPAKVRVLSSGIPAASSVRRRGDPEGNGADKASGPASIVETGMPEGASAGRGLLWIAGVIVLFVTGCALGGILMTISLLYPELF